ncbi:MAG: AAA family ATPase [Rhizobiales bacterium]|nr:AAA family ATPase [Hyphomicrobiales bacterium]
MSNAAGLVERRQLTVMFCDLVGSTKLSLALDPEDYTTLVRGYRDAVAGVVRQWNGYVARFMGDGVLIYFGYPRAAEDDALRAVSAAWDLPRSIASLSLADLSLKADAQLALPLATRIGIHTGLALVGDTDGDERPENDAVSGSAPNIAAKLQALAKPGEIIVSDATALLLPPSVVLEQTDFLNARTDSIGVKAYVVTAQPQPTPVRRPITMGHFIGRDALMSRVTSTITNADNENLIYLFQGEPGIGKSKFAHEVAAHPFAVDYFWLDLSCHPQGQSSTLHPFSSMLSGPGEVESDGSTQTDLSQLSPFQRRRKTFERLKAKILSHGPKIGVLLDDIHWADPTTLEFLGELTSTATSSQLLLLMTSRDPPPRALAEMSAPRVEKLDRLLPGEAAELANATAGARVLTSFELAEIVDRADGNPLYIEEFARAVLDHGGAIVKPGEERIPSTLRDSLMGRLDGLGVGRKVALHASVLGRQFAFRHVLELCDVSEHELVVSLQALVNANILLQAGTIPNATFEFRHALLRDVAYQTLLKSDRERLHGRVAQLAVAGALGDIDSMPERLAIHYSLSGNFQESITHWLKAGRDAVKRSANAEALDHLRKGLEDCRRFKESDAEDAAHAELELLSTLPAPLIAVSGWSSPELKQVYDDAATLSDTIGSEEATFHLERGRFNLHLLRSELGTADVIADKLIQTARRTSDTETQQARLVEALRTKGLVEFYRGSYATAHGLLSEMMAAYDPARHASHAYQHGAEPAAVALSYLGWLDCLDGKHTSGLDKLERALEYANMADHAFSICYAHCFAASCAQLRADPKAAEASAIDAIRLSNQHNFQYWLAWGRAVRGWVQGLTAAEAGLQEINEARTAYLATGSTLIAPYFTALACNVGRHWNLPGIEERENNTRAEAQSTGVMFWEPALVVKL